MVSPPLLLLTITVVPSFLPTVYPHVQCAWFTHSVAHCIFALRGLDREAARDRDQPGLGPGKGRGKCGQKSPEQRGEVREGLVRAASKLHCLTV